MKRKFILLYILFMALSASSQDMIILRNGDRLNCKITKTDSLTVYFRIKKKDRDIASFMEKKEIRSYQLNDSMDLADKKVNLRDLNTGNKIVVLDTTVYIKSFNKWINLITYSQKFGVHADGWTIQYYGYILKNDSKWILPILFGIENYRINQDYFNRSNYQSVRTNYYLGGISPLRKLNDSFYASIGFQLIYGTEELIDSNNNEILNSIFGIAPSQGILFIPKSKVGLTIGIGVYEKLISSEIYKNDVGLKLEIGVKF